MHGRDDLLDVDALEVDARGVKVRVAELSLDDVQRDSLTGEQNLSRSYDEAIRRAHAAGVMVNGSFVFGLDDDGPDVFDRTVEWAISRSLETATFHIMTPCPGTALYRRLATEGRIVSDDWDQYDTRHVVYRPLKILPVELESGYWRAYREFYRWRAIVRGATGQEDLRSAVRHFAYAGGWKKLEPLWDWVIRTRHVGAMLPVLEQTLDAFGGARRTPERRDAPTRLREPSESGPVQARAASL